MRFYNCTGLFLLFVKFFTFFFSKDVVPLWQFIQPVSLCIYHVLIKKFFIKSKCNFGIFIHGLDRIRDLKAVVDTVKETNHSHNILSIFLSQFFNCTAYHFIRIGKKLLINAFFDIKIVCPESLELIAVCLLIVGNLTPLL